MIGYFNVYRVIKYYILFWFFKFICVMIYKISQISHEQLKIHELLYTQNKKILASETIELLHNQVINNFKENNSQKNSSLLLTRLSKLHDSSTNQ